MNSNAPYAGCLKPSSHRLRASSNLRVCVALGTLSNLLICLPRAMEHVHVVCEGMFQQVPMLRASTTPGCLAPCPGGALRRCSVSPACLHAASLHHESSRWLVRQEHSGCRVDSQDLWCVWPHAPRYNRYLDYTLLASIETTSASPRRTLH